MQTNQLFTESASVQTSRILYTPSPFARASLLHLQEVGSLTALRPHTSSRGQLQSYLCFVVEHGEGKLIYDGEGYPLTAGDVVFIDCRKPYSHSTGETLWSLRWCHFFGPSMPAIYAKYGERGGSPVFHPQSAELYLSLISEIYSIASSADYIRDMRLNEKLNGLLTLLMSASWRGGDYPSGMKRTEISQVKSFLDEHFGEKISLESVAEAFFLDKSYLARRFKEQYGVTLLTYLQQVRITHAKRMLRFTDKSLEDIALECGMADANYFSRVFKKLEGIPPGQFRRMW